MSAYGREGVINLKLPSLHSNWLPSRQVGSWMYPMTSSSFCCLTESFRLMERVTWLSPLRSKNLKLHHKMKICTTLTSILNPIVLQWRFHFTPLGEVGFSADVISIRSTSPTILSRLDPEHSLLSRQWNVANAVPIHGKRPALIKKAPVVIIINYERVILSPRGWSQTSEQQEKADFKVRLEGILWDPWNCSLGIPRDSPYNSAH